MSMWDTLKFLLRIYLFLLLSKCSATALRNRQLPEPFEVSWITEFTTKVEGITNMYDKVVTVTLSTPGEQM